jgi:transposase InsO family protein
LVELIQEAHTNGSRIEVACREAGLSLRSYRRWFQRGEVQVDKRPDTKKPEPENKLSKDEKQAIVDVGNEEHYASLPPTQIVPSLLDKGIYLASESSFYRVLNAHKQLNHRGRSQAPKKQCTPTSFAATGPNQVWSWDITYLSSPVKGLYYYLYMFEDIYSRKIVGYEVHEKECGELAAQLVQRCMLREQCFDQPLVLHSDNGAPMKAQTMRAKLDELGVQSSFSRPRVSNDNPYSEALLKTLKYRPNWPTSGFESLADARDWVDDFVVWYNTEHKHSKLNFVTPSERHAQQDGKILAKRKQVLENAKAANPNHWSQSVRNCEPIGVVMLNPDKVENIEMEALG